MSAKKKAIIGAVIGAILFPVLYGFGVLANKGSSPTMQEYGMLLFAFIMGAIGGFGFAFGLPLGKRWFCAVFGVAATASIFSFMFTSNRYKNFVVNFTLWILLLSLTIGICYLPGIVIGIKELIAESRGTAV